MWNCPNCKCQGIAPDVLYCPQCFQEHPEVVPESTPTEDANQSPPDTGKGWGAADAKDK